MLLTFSSEYPSWTFGHEKNTSYSAFEILESHGENFTISFLLRSLKHSGLLVQLQREEDPYLTVYLKEGTVAIYSPHTTLISEAKHVTDGKNNMVTVKLQYGHVVFPKAGHRRALGNVSVEAGDVAYVGGLPAASSMKAWGGNFKGCLQDIRLDNKRLTSEDPGDGGEVYPASTEENVLPGCQSDDTCKVRKNLFFCAWKKRVTCLLSGERVHPWCPARLVVLLSACTVFSLLLTLIWL